MRNPRLAVVMVGVAAFAFLGPFGDDTDDAAPAPPAARKPSPTATVTTEPPTPAPPVDPVAAAATAGVLAWQADDETLRQGLLATTATPRFTAAMVAVDPATVGPCTPTTTGVTAATAMTAQVVVVCAGPARALVVDLTRTDPAAAWLVDSILPGD